MVAAGKAALAASLFIEPVGHRDLEGEDRLTAIRPVLQEQVGAALAPMRLLVAEAVGNAEKLPSEGPAWALFRGPRGAQHTPRPGILLFERL